jgi:hypothetical protein
MIIENTDLAKKWVRTNRILNSAPKIESKKENKPQLSKQANEKNKAPQNFQCKISTY